MGEDAILRLGATIDMRTAKVTWSTCLCMWRLCLYLKKIKS